VAFAENASFKSFGIISWSLLPSSLPRELYNIWCSPFFVTFNLRNLHNYVNWLVFYRESREAIRTLLVHLQRLIKSMNSKQVLEGKEKSIILKAGSQYDARSCVTLISRDANIYSLLF
jgi:hypothetical protein